MGPIPSGRLKNLKDFDKWSSLSRCPSVREMSELENLGCTHAVGWVMIVYEYNTNTKMYTPFSFGLVFYLNLLESRLKILWAKASFVVESRDGSVGWYLSNESILIKYHDKILKTPLRLPTHMMEERVKMLEAYPTSEEIVSFYPICFCAFADFIVTR